MNGQYHPLLVALSAFVAVYSSAIYLLIARAMPDFDRQQRMRWRMGAAIMMGGGIWSMHFVGMLAFELPIEVSYHSTWTAASAIPSIVVSGILFLLLEQHVLGIHPLVGKRFWWGGLVFGMGVVVMHLVGMHAMEVQPGIEYRIGELLLAGLAAVSSAWAALKLGLDGGKDFKQPVVFTLALGLALVAMHYIGMHAAHFSALSVCISSPDSLSGTSMAAWVGAGSIGLASVTAVGLLFEQQRAQNHSRKVLDLQAALAEVQHKTDQIEEAGRHEQAKEEAKRSAMMETAEVNFFEIDVLTDTIAFSDKFLYLGNHKRLPLEKTRKHREEWERRVHPDDVEAMRTLLNEFCLGVVTSYESQYRIDAGQGDWRWILSRARIVERTEEGAPRLIYGTLIDIHQRYLNELALEEERHMFTTGPVVMIRAVYHKGESRFIYVSSNVVKLWGYEPQALLSLSSSMALVHPDDVERLRDEFWRAMTSTDVSVLDVEVRLRMADGKYRWHRYNTTIDRKVSERKGYFIDIDARKQAELDAQNQSRRLEETISQLEAAQGEGGVLQETSDMLHATEDINEAFDIIRLSAQKLFPGWSGWVSASRGEEQELMIGATWGDISEGLQRRYHSRDCWGMRRGKPHAFFTSLNSVCCAHLANIPAGELKPYLCLPMAAHGETVGALHLFGATDDVPTEEQMQDVQQRALRYSETLKLALSNLKLRSTLQDQAMKDGLTGLYNRRFMDERLPTELARARREGRPVAVAMIDVDHFKHFNDQYGHDAGDHVLRMISKEIQSGVRGYDIACRYGGEELALIMSGCTAEAAQARLEEMREKIAALELTHNAQALSRVTVSIGVADGAELSPEELLKRSDACLYKAKRLGRNRVIRHEA